MKIVTDLDETIINSAHTILNIYNYVHNTNIEYHNNFEWSFEGLIPNPDRTELLGYFENDLFYDERFLVIESGAIEIINRMSVDNKIFICSKHSKCRIPKTIKWINETFNGNVEFIPVESFDKSSVGRCDIFIDDRIDALNSVLGIANVRICYNKYKWNLEWVGHRVNSWETIERDYNYFKTIKTK